MPSSSKVLQRKGNKRDVFVAIAIQNVLNAVNKSKKHKCIYFQSKYNSFFHLLSFEMEHNIYSV